MLMKEFLNDHTPEWIFENVVPLAQHFNLEADEENPYYELDMIATFISEHIKYGQAVVYPLPKSGVMPHRNTKYLVNKLNALGVITRGIFISGSDTGTCQEPISSTDIQLAPALFDAFASLTISDMYLRFVNTLYTIFDLEFTNNPEEVIQAVYTELSKLNRSIPYTTKEPKELFGIVYKTAMKEVYRWLSLNNSLYTVNDIDAGHSKILYNTLLNTFISKLDLIGTKIDDEDKLLEMTEDAIVWENIIIWFHLGYFVLHLKEPRLAYNRYMDCASFRNFTKEGYMKLIKRAQDRSTGILRGNELTGIKELIPPTAIEINGILLKKPIIIDPSVNDDGTGRKEIADAITSLLGTGKVITQLDIDFYLPPNLVAMCAYEYGSKNFEPKATDDDEFNVKYYYTMNNHRFVLFTVKGYDDTVYGWATCGPKTIIMLSGDKGYDYKLVVEDSSVELNYKK